MSYSSELKTEASDARMTRHCCIVAEAAALLHAAGSIDLGGRKMFGFTLTNENEAVIRRAQKLLRKLDETLPISTVMREQQRHHLLCSTAAPCPEAGAILEKTQLLIRSGDTCSFGLGLPQALVKKSCCRRAFIRGIFLGCGTVSDINKGYNADMVFHLEEFARDFSALLALEDIRSTVTKRRSAYVVYIKDSGDIEKLLSVVGAARGVLDIENKRLYNELINNANRAVNCDTANTMKTITASARVCAAIEKLERCGVFGDLSEPLRRAAEVRMEYPDVSLDELCSLCSDGVTKSGMNHRLRRLCAIADGIREEDGNDGNTRNNA